MNQIVSDFLRDNGISTFRNDRGETVIVKGNTEFPVLSEQGMKVTARIAHLIAEKHDLDRFHGVHLRSELHRISLPKASDNDVIESINEHFIWDRPRIRGNFFDNMDRYNG